MKIRSLFIADPVERLNPKGDTSLSMLRASIKRGHSVYWGTSDGVEFSDGKVWVRAKKVLGCGENAIPVLDDEERFQIQKFHLGYIRKDPPFDVSYVRLCWILALAERDVLFLNSPSSLLRYHEKLVPLEAFAAGYLKKSDLIPTHFGNPASTREFLKAQKAKSWVTKPFLGHGGRDIQLRTTTEVQMAVEKGDWDETLVQPFLEEVRSEDRRILIVNGKMIGQFVRIPPEGAIVANLAQGGKAEAKKLSAAQTAAVGRIAAFLKKAGIFFAGADLIGPKISEVNITSPTGFRSVEALTGIDPAEVYLDQAERILKSRLTRGA